MASDGRSYRAEHFDEALRIASDVGLPHFDSNLAARLQSLADAVQAAASTAVADEEVLLLPTLCMPSHHD